MLSGWFRANTPQPAPRRTEIHVDPLITPPQFPPFERKSADGQFEIIHSPKSLRPTSPLELPVGLLVNKSSLTTPRSDLLHDILISIPTAHWTRLVSNDSQDSALTTVLLLIKSPILQEVHFSLTQHFHASPQIDRSHAYNLIGIHLVSPSAERNANPPYKLCATFLAWKRECHNFTTTHKLSHSPICSTDALVDWLIHHINSPSKLHHYEDFYSVFADIATQHTSMRVSTFRQHLTSFEGRISILNYIIKDNLSQWFLQFTTTQILGPTLQVEQPILTQLSASLHPFLSSNLKWGHFLTSTSTRQQLANDWLAKTYISNPPQPKQTLNIHQLINTIPIKICIRDNLFLQPDTPVQIDWIHDRQGFQEIEARTLPSHQSPSLSFIAPTWYFNFPPYEVARAPQPLTLTPG